jgi:hypothetical protein
MIDGHLNNATEIFGRNMIDSSYIHAPRFHYRLCRNARKNLEW